MIEIKHLDIQFKQQVIFKNANFKTCPGKITGIIGKSGCGKTTFLKALIYQYKNQILSIDKQVITYCIVSVILINLEHSLKI